MPSAPDQPILYSPSPEGVTVITINRPHVRNAIDHPASLLLAQAFRSFEADPTQRVCILTGKGTTFCTGYDLQEVASSTQSTNSDSDSDSGANAVRVQPVDKVNGTLGPMGPTRMSFTKPVIAAISGHAVAGGLELSLLAHIRIVDSTAVFGVFCRRFGVPLIDGGTVRLQRIVGLGRAMDMILTGRPVNAQEAHAIGLANRVVERGLVLDSAMQMARDLLQFPQKCMRADLASTQYGAYKASSLEDALRFEFENGADMVNEEGIRGAQRFRGGQGRGGSFKLSKL